MDDYTPTTDVVRAEYWEHGAYRYGAARGDEFQAEFDRWYAAEKAKWQAEAWDEGVLLMASRHNISVGPDWLRLSNPHRIERGE